jgi:regulator of sigma E protease
MPSDVEEVLLENAGEEVTLLIVRDGEFMRPTLTPEDGTDPLGAALTFESETELVYQSIPEALIDGVRQTIDVILYIPRAISDAIQGLIPAETLRPVSPLGVSQLASDAIQMSVEQGAAYYVIQFAALISVAVGISNLLPLPALDGGRIVFVIVEMIRGKRIDPVREGTIHMAGFLFFMAVMVLLVIVDIIDPLSLLN